MPRCVADAICISQVVCACTSKYFTFVDIWDTSYQFWYLREASLAMYATNLPYVWGLARQSFRVLRSSNLNTDVKHGNGLKTAGTRSRTRGRLNALDTGSDRVCGIPRTESEENIIEMNGLGVGAARFREAARWERDHIRVDGRSSRSLIPGRRSSILRKRWRLLLKTRKVGSRCFAVYLAFEFISYSRVEIINTLGVATARDVPRVLSKHSRSITIYGHLYKDRCTEVSPGSKTSNPCAKSDQVRYLQSVAYLLVPVAYLYGTATYRIHPRSRGRSRTGRSRSGVHEFRRRLP